MLCSEQTRISGTGYVDVRNLAWNGSDHRITDHLETSVVALLIGSLITLGVRIFRIYESNYCKMCIVHGWGSETHICMRDDKVVLMNADHWWCHTWTSTHSCLSSQMNRVCLRPQPDFLARIWESMSTFEESDTKKIARSAIFECGVSRNFLKTRHK